MKTDWCLVAALTVILVIVLLAIANATETGGCGSGIAAQDIAGNCRAANPTPGALESVEPRTPPKPGGVRIVPPKPGGVIIESR